LPEAAAARKGSPWANPSSPHQFGQAARTALDSARDRVAVALGVGSAELAFCASGTEAVNLALLGAGRRLPEGRALVTWAGEHQAVLGAARELQLEGVPVVILPTDRFGLADLSLVPAEAGLISLGLANNELGTVQPVAEVAALAQERGALLHLDCCQGPRWLRPPLELVDLASFSGAKLGAGPGGLLYGRQEVRLQPLVYGGPQEWGRRAGREDVGSALAMAAALGVCAAHREEEAERVALLSDRLLVALNDAGGELTGGEPRLPNYATAVFSQRRGEDLLLALDAAGIAASSGSACASGSLDPSHVLLAAGYTLEAALGSLRLTAGYDTTAAEVECAVETLRRVLRRQSIRPLAQTVLSQPRSSN